VAVKYLLKIEGAAPVLYRSKTVAHRDGCRKVGDGNVYTIARVVEGDRLTILSEHRYLARN